MRFVLFQTWSMEGKQWPFCSLYTQLTHWKRPWFWERLKAEGEEGNRMRWVGDITDSMDMNLGKLWEMVRDREAWRATVPWGRRESDMTGRLNKNKICPCSVS